MLQCTFLVDPALLLLDEATSSLDSDTEALIQDGLGQIVALEAGRVVECGRHDNLLALGGHYAALHRRQQRAARDCFVNPGEELEAVD